MKWHQSFYHPPTNMLYYPKAKSLPGTHQLTNIMTTTAEIILG